MWIIKQNETQKLEVARRRVLRSLLGFTGLDHQSNSDKIIDH